jgi:hypothetical protein
MDERTEINSWNLTAVTLNLTDSRETERPKGRNPNNWEVAQILPNGRKVPSLIRVYQNAVALGKVQLMDQHSERERKADWFLDLEIVAVGFLLTREAQCTQGHLLTIALCQFSRVSLKDWILLSRPSLHLKQRLR